MRLATLALAFLLTGRLATASPGATLCGVIVDGEQLSLPSATITAVETRTGKRTSTTADTDGAFALTNLPAGTYAISAELPGFHMEAIVSVHLRRSEIRTLPLSMTLEPIGDELIVIKRR